MTTAPNTKRPNSTRMVNLALTTALAGAALAGCTAKVAPPAQASADKAQTMLVKGKTDKAVMHAEAAVLAAPRDAAGRAMLAGVYMEAGRFASAATTYAEAMELGDDSSRTVVSLALAQIATGQQNASLETLNRYRDRLDAADYGLAMALAGRPREGVHVLANLLRGGSNTVKVRQNLAYAYALEGNWRAARLMVAEDLPANEVGDRMAHWAAMIAPEFYQHRVADLLGAPMVADSGQPAKLALNRHQSVDQLAAEVTAPEAGPVVASGELPAVAVAVGEVEAPAGVATPPAARGPQFVRKEVVQALPQRHAGAASARPAPQRVAAVAKPSTPDPAPLAMESGDYRVQLGSYFSMSDAQAAWKVFLARHPELKDAQKVITKARVKGRIYYRVAAGGFARTSAVGLCGKVKRGGAGCIAYAADRPLPGALENPARLAAR